jgi:glycosyltransferase involved in cell wall biosynthesis
MPPKISIIVPCYNHGHFLDEALSSLPDPSEASYEVIITNDGSTDEFTLEKLKSLEARGLQVIHQQNQGLAAARNNAIAAAQGEYLLPLDCDNKLMPTYFEEAVRLLDSTPSIDVVYGDPVFFGDQSGRRHLRDFELVRMALYGYIDACAIFRKSALERAGGYDGNMPKMGNEDWELWLRLYLDGARFHYLQKPCFLYRSSKTSMSATTTGPGYYANRTYVYAKHRHALVRRLLHERALPRFLRLAEVDAALELLLPPPFLPSELVPKVRRSARALKRLTRPLALLKRMVGAR